MDVKESLKSQGIATPALGKISELGPSFGPENMVKKGSSVA
jgi:hypothetical protein